MINQSICFCTHYQDLRNNNANNCGLCASAESSCCVHIGPLHNGVMSLSASTLDIVHKYKDCVIISKKQRKKNRREEHNCLFRLHLNKSENGKARKLLL